MLLNSVASGSFQKLENRGQKLQGDFLANVTKYFFYELFNTPSSQDTLTHGRFSIMLTNEGIKRDGMVTARHTHFLSIFITGTSHGARVEAGFNTFG